MALGCLDLESDRYVGSLVRRGYPRHRILEFAAIVSVQHGCLITFTTYIFLSIDSTFRYSQLIGYRPTP
jgi:hypothetical protein